MGQDLDSAIRAAYLWSRSGDAERFGRSDCLRPPSLPSDLIWKNESADYNEPEAPIADCTRLVLSVIEARRLRVSEIARPSKLEELGRLAVFEPFATLADELSCVESDGLVDEFDELGWDYWVGVAGQGREFKILCWLPAVHADLFGKAIDVNCTEAVRWLSESPSDFETAAARCKRRQGRTSSRERKVPW